MSWLSFTARKWFYAALTIARRCDGRAWNVSHTKFLSPISTLQPKPNPASCHFSCVQIEIDHRPREANAGTTSYTPELGWDDRPRNRLASLYRAATDRRGLYRTRLSRS